jgi:hypothetical protein
LSPGSGSHLLVSGTSSLYGMIRRPVGLALVPPFGCGVLTVKSASPVRYNKLSDPFPRPKQPIYAEHLKPVSSQVLLRAGCPQDCMPRFTPSISLLLSDLPPLEPLAATPHLP